jgi:HEPN domain-containing protein
MADDPVLVAETRAWLAKAPEDLATSEYELKADPPFTSDISFHAQQAAEKALKGFLTWHGQAFRKTHNLTELGEPSDALDPTLGELLKSGSGLTEYAWKFR